MMLSTGKQQRHISYDKINFTVTVVNIFSLVDLGIYLLCVVHCILMYIQPLSLELAIYYSICITQEDHSNDTELKYDN